MYQDTDLLLVALALKTDLVTPEQVSECGTALAEDRSSSLIDLLVEKGYLAEMDRDAIEGLADSKSRAHGGDAGQTLLALNVDEQARQSLIALPLDEDDRGTILSLKASPAPEGGTLLKFDGGSSVVESIRQKFEVEADVDLGHPDEQATIAKAPVARPGDDLGKEPESTLGKHHLLGEIARGGMGAIMEARDPDLRREVAVKVMLPSASANPDVVARFVEEAQVQGQLAHPNVCPVYEIAQGKDDLPYFLMKRVRGKPLSDVIEEYHEGGDVNLTRLVEIFLKVCDAMGFAHSRGVIHRDLKPANVMVGDYGEVLVMDWGLAKIKGRKDTREKSLTVETDRSEGDAVLTMDGDVIGTPAYMPPEQADGAVGKMNETSDIYSLGAILYEILAGVPPFSGTPYNILFKVMKGEVVPPSDLSSEERPSKRLPSRRGKKGRRKAEAAPAATSRAVPRELEAVVMKAMANEQEGRYASVKALRDDILAWTEGRTLQAVEYTSLERAAKWVGRNKALSGFIGLGTAAALVIGVILLLSFQAQRVARETGERVAKEEQAKAARAVIEKDMEEARKYLAACEAAYRKAAAPKMVEMEVVPPGQSVEYCNAVERGPMTDAERPYEEATAEPEWDKGPKPPPSVCVPERKLGIAQLREATENGSLSVILVGRARVRIEREGFSDLSSRCADLSYRCHLAYAGALSASGDHERAAAELEGVPHGIPGRSDAESYAKGICRLAINSDPPESKAVLLFLADESVKPEGAPLFSGTTPVEWTEIPRGTYLLHLEKKGFASVLYHLRLDRNLPREAAHELAVLSGTRAEFSDDLRAEMKRLSGTRPAIRRVHIYMVPSSLVPKDFVVIPAGSFLAGEGKSPVFLDTYLASEKELSAGDWLDYLDSSGIPVVQERSEGSPKLISDTTWSVITRNRSSRNFPAPALSWKNARSYLRWRNVHDRSGDAPLFTLPTELMWEKAARGVDGRIYPWGDVYDKHKVNGAELRPLAAGDPNVMRNFDPVDLDLGTSVFGLNHASGNVAEWCLDQSMENERYRITKGGGYTNGASELRLAGRVDSPIGRFLSYGFRIFVPLHRE